MKKALVIAAALVVVPAFGWAATTCNTGSYTGKIWSIDKALNGTTGNLEVKKDGEKCVMNFKAPEANEVWEISGKTLAQKEMDLKTSKVVQQYNANLEGTDKWAINCKDKAKNDCDAGVDSRNYWEIKTTPNEVVYSVYGVGSENKGKADAKVVKRHEFTFTKTTTTTTK